MARAEAGERIDDLLDKIAELQRLIDSAPARPWRTRPRSSGGSVPPFEQGQPARLLAGALQAVERVAARST